MQAVATSLHFRAPPGGYSYRHPKEEIMTEMTFIYLARRAEYYAEKIQNNTAILQQRGMQQVQERERYPSPPGRIIIA